MTVITSSSLRFAQLPGRASADPLAAVEADVDVASSVRVVRLVRTDMRRAHVHPRSEEIVYVAAGSGTVWIDGGCERVAAGDVVHIPAGAPHATLPDAGSTVELVCFFPHPDLAANLTETARVVDPEGPTV